MDCHQRYLQSTQRVTQFCQLQILLCFCFCAQLVQVLLQFGVAIRNAVGYLDLVVFVLTVVLKTQPEVGPHLEFVQLGSVDAPPLEFYVEAVLLPSHALLLILLFRKNIRFHSSCE